MTQIHPEFLHKFDYLTDGIWELDIMSETVLLSQNASKLFGHQGPLSLSREDILNTFIHDDYKHKLTTEICRSLTTGNRLIDTEIKTKSKYNGCKWIHLRGIPVSEDTDGKPVCLIGSMTDRSRVKDVPEEISGSPDNLKRGNDDAEIFFQTLVNTSPNGVIVTDHAGSIKFASHRVYEIFKIPESYCLIGESVFNRVSPVSIITAKENFNSASVTRRAPDVFEYVCIRNDKTEVWIEVSASPLKDNTGITTGLMLVCRDISDRKRSEEELLAAKNKAEENDRLKTSFLHNISHEIRTPMNAIVGFGSLLSQCNCDRNEIDSYITTIQDSTQQLLSVINDIVDFACIEAGSVKITETTFCLNAILRNIQNQFSNVALEKSLSFHLFPGLPDNESLITTDQTRLIQIISHLLDNSFKFTRDGLIAFGYEVNNNDIEFFVSDTGPGIAEEHQSDIFRSFFQIESSMCKHYRGTGLGLAICKAYVELLGGSIRIESILNVGSTFIFTIPFSQPENRKNLWNNESHLL